MRAKALVVVMSGGASDTTAPTVAITSSESSPTATSPIPITVTFSEEVTGFAVGDLTLGNGSAGDFATADNIVFTANITPTAAGEVTVDIDAAVCQDLAGNDNEAATQFSIQYATLLSGIVAYWKLDEESDGSAPVTRVDSVSSVNLTDNNTVTSVLALVSRGAHLDVETTEFLSCVDNAALSMGDIDFSFALWWKPDQDVSMDILNKYTAEAGKREYALFYNASTDLLSFRASPDGGTGTTTVNISLAITPGNWYFIVCGHDAANNVLFVQVNNGTAETQAHTTGVHNGTSDFALGKASVIGQNIDAVLDEVGCWKKVLSAAERTELYNGGSGTTHPF